MKKKLLIVAVTVIIVSIFVSCSANSSSENVSTTAVTDSNGATHYYEPVTDNKGNLSTTSKDQGVFAEIETESNGKAVTRKGGTYVTNENTTVLPIISVTDNTISTTKPTTEKSSTGTTRNIDNADNVVEFEPTNQAEETKPDPTTTEKQATATTETTEQKETQPITDKDGWINKWY